MARLNGHDDRDFADRLKPTKFTGPVRGGGLAGEPPAGDSGGGGFFRCREKAAVILLVFAGAVWGLVEAGLAVAKAVA